MPDRFSILGYPPGIPWGLLERHANTVLRNHSQSLQDLNLRGGLRMEEVAAALRDERWDGREDSNAKGYVQQRIDSYVASLTQDPNPPAQSSQQVQPPVTPAVTPAPQQPAQQPAPAPAPQQPAPQQATPAPAPAPTPQAQSPST